MTVDKEDLIDQVQAEWLSERPDLDASGLGVVGRIINLADRFRRQGSGEPFQLTPTKLMQSVLLTSGAITATTNRLVNKGLAYRIADQNDGRVKIVALTKSGKTLIDQAVKNRFMVADSALEKLSPKETVQFVWLLRKLSLSAGSV
ncbi:MAG: DNA-binding MarR family transcriptional regulator [Patiriisocius sp.]|jgi:DNA-binding MarR family transcriptional regulator